MFEVGNMVKLISDECTAVEVDTVGVVSAVGFMNAEVIFDGIEQLIPLQHLELIENYEVDTDEVGTDEIEKTLQGEEILNISVGTLISSDATRQRWGWDEGLQNALDNKVILEFKPSYDTHKFYVDYGNFTYSIHVNDIEFVKPCISTIEDFNDDNNIIVEKPTSINTVLQGFKEVYINGEKVKTPDYKVNYFYNVFETGLKIAKDEKVSDIKVVDDLTIEFNIKLDEERIESIRKEALEGIDFSSELFSYNKNATINCILYNNQMASEDYIRIIKRYLLNRFKFDAKRLAQYPKTLQTLTEVYKKILNIREQEGKLFRFLNRNVLNLLKWIIKNEYVEDINNACMVNVDTMLNILTRDLNKLTDANNFKGNTKYFVTFDSNKIIQCSYNTTGWRSCYNMLDGEYRASAIYTMAHKRIGMIYSLSSSGEMRNRRFIDVVNGGVNFGAWYPKVPTGSVNIINSNIMRMLGLKQDNLTEEKDFEARGDSDTNDFEIYKDFSYGSCYAVYENNDAKSDLHNVYYVHNENYSEYFEFIQDCTEQSLDYTNKEKIYLTI